MAGMRIGYAIGMADTVKPLAKLKMPYNVSVFGVAAAIASLNDPKHIEDERKRNTEVRAFTVKALQDMGAKPADSQGNFIFVDIGRPAKDFRDACAKSGVMVGRDFPPFEKSHCRISIGTMDEMKKAVDVFRAALKTTTRRRATGRREVAMLTRRRFVQTTVGTGAAAYIGARGRENSLWSAFEPTLEAVAPGMICLSSNENPLGPGATVLDGIKSAFGPAGAPPGRYSAARASHRRDREEAGRQAREHRPRLRLDADPALVRRISSPRRTRRWSARSRPTKSAPATPR